MGNFSNTFFESIFFILMSVFKLMFLLQLKSGGFGKANVNACDIFEMTCRSRENCQHLSVPLSV